MASLSCGDCRCWQIQIIFDGPKLRLKKTGYVFRWFPIKQRIKYRVVTLVWRCLKGLDPIYLIELCRLIKSTLGTLFLRSAEQGLLQVPLTNTSIWQNRAFSVLGSSVWNNPLLLLRSLHRNQLSTIYSITQIYVIWPHCGWERFLVPLEEARYKSL